MFLNLDSSSCSLVPDPVRGVRSRREEWIFQSFHAGLLGRIAKQNKNRARGVAAVVIDLGRIECES
jgi:hypothetical protein